jgi:putative ABC transport system permease protein
VAVLTLALGIGATTAIFTVVYAVLLRPLPYPQPNRLLYIRGDTWGPFSSGREYLAWKDRSQTLSQIAAYIESQANLTGGGEAERVTFGTVSASFFRLLGVQPVLGRIFLPEEDRPGAPPVAIISHALWKRRFGGDPSVIGRALTLDAKSYTVIGVLPASFLVPDQYGADYDLWMPFSVNPNGAVPILVRVIGRLKPGVSYDQARAELNTILQSTLPKGRKRHAVVVPWHEDITGKARLPLLVFLAAVGCLLLIACANVVNLLLSRAATRQKEIAVRLTVGAGRSRIVRQLLTESALLALMGGILGLALASWVKDLLVAFISPNLPTLEPISLDYRVLGFSLALAAVTGLAFGLAPALQASRVSLNEVLKEAGRNAAESRSGMLFRSLLLVSETALAMVLLVGASLLFRSFLRTRGIDPGFKSEHTLSLTIDLTLSRYPTRKDQARFFEQVIERIKNLAGVQLVGGSNCPPLLGRSGTVDDLAIEGRREKIPIVSVASITPDYFRAMGIPLKQGRYFGDGDRDGSPRVAIVSESFARRFFAGESCLGRRVEGWIQQNSWLTIVGVVGDVRGSLESDPNAVIYVPYLQAGEPFMILFVHTAGKPMLWAGSVRRQVASLDKDEPPHDLATLEELEARSLTPRRVNMLLLGTFAGLGLILASVGVYGVVSYSVSQRTHEIGVRMALGAERGDVLKIVVGQGLRSALAGTCVGVAASIGLTRFLQTMLFGVKPTDPVTFVAVSLVLLVVAWLACYIPARRATKIDPIEALRYE